MLGNKNYKKSYDNSKNKHSFNLSSNLSTFFTQYLLVKLIITYPYRDSKKYYSEYWYHHEKIPLYKFWGRQRLNLAIAFKKLSWGFVYFRLWNLRKSKACKVQGKVRSLCPQNHAETINYRAKPNLASFVGKVGSCLSLSS